MPWKIATAVVAVLAVVALIWGVMQKRDADRAAQDSAAQIDELQAQIAADTEEEEQVKEALNKAQAAHDKVEAKLKVKGENLKNEASKLKNLEAQYNQAQKNASAKQATLKDELAAQRAKTALATKCAQVMATGMSVIYNAESPHQVMNDVVREMQKAAANCDGVVNVG